MRYLTVSLFLIILISPAIGWLAGIDQKLNERRTLAVMPKISFDNVYKKNLYVKLDKYLNDHFVFKAPLVKAKSWLDYYVFKVSSVSKEVYIGKDGWLFRYKSILHNYRGGACEASERLRQIVKNIHELEKVIKDSGRKFIFVVAPDKATIYPEQTGFSQIISECGKTMYGLLLEHLEEYPVEGFLRLDTLLTEAKKDKRLYFKTDGHWNMEGARVFSRVVIDRLAPGLVDKHFSLIMPNSKKVPGDLARMLSLDLEKAAVYTLPQSYASKVDIELLEHKKTKRKRLKFTSRLYPDDVLLPRTVFFRDSFMIIPLVFLGSPFRHLDVNWTYNIMDPETQDDLIASEIVLIEVVERLLLFLNIDPAEVAALLSDAPAVSNR